ncbi:MAG TPA: response regulator [Myxococcaceae bacterium]|nr:response regulator [Myxococcaceae bacterium]
MSVEAVIRVLIVEDDTDSRELLAELLQGELPGGRVETAPNAEVALERAGSFDPTVVVSDLTLPGMDGVALCRELRARENPPGVILVTGHPDAAGLEGFDAVLAKPLDIEELASAVRMVTRQGTTETDAAPAP